jgi:hypothetical protein
MNLLRPTLCMFGWKVEQSGSRNIILHSGGVWFQSCNVTIFSNYLYCKLSQASSAMINQVIDVRNQNSKSGV